MIDYFNYIDPVPGWFNIDSQANLYPEKNNFTEAKVSLNLMLDEIDRIKNAENVDYKNIYLGGFSQGAMMTNYILYFFFLINLFKNIVFGFIII